MASGVVIHEYITSGNIGNRYMGFNCISFVMEGMYNNEMISFHFILINDSKT
jgi:hypothetical protein